MARPRLEIGAWGVIRIKEITPPGTPKRDQKHEASAQFRRRDGSYTRMRRFRSTGPRAEADLIKAMVAEAQKIKAEQLGRDTRVSKVIDLWLAELRKQVDRGDSAANTLSQYRTNANKWVEPYIGELGVGTELRVRHLDDVLTNARDTHGLSGETTNNIKKVLLGFCAYAVRHDAMDTNLARSVAAIGRKDSDKSKEKKALDQNQRRDLVEQTEARCQERYVEADGKKLGARDLLWRQLPKMVRAMLATGQRIGELLAMAGDDITLDDDGRIVVLIRAHLVRDADRGGLVRVKGRKNDQPNLRLGVPAWSEPMWTQLAAAAKPGNPIFPSYKSPAAWLDDSNVQSKIKQVFKESGYGWVTPKTFRLTVSEVLRAAGFSDEEIAVQLGNTPGVVRKHYQEHEKQINDRQREALDAHMFGSTVDSPDGQSTVD